MKVNKQVNISIDAFFKDTYIFATYDGKLSLNGTFIELIIMVIGIICNIYDCGNDDNKEFLKYNFVDVIKELAKNNFDVDKLK